jgi:hypothetical protein
MTVGYQADDPNNEEMESHVEHCISLTCGDFLTVEPNASGWGLERKCINDQKLRAFWLDLILASESTVRGVPIN